MATYTENYNLEKPAQSDLYNIDVFNENADKVDEALGDKAENQSLAPIESSATASRNYSIGQQFVYNGLIYEATSAIASGGTITPGSNCARTTVAEELSALNDSLANIDTPVDIPANTNLNNYTTPGIYACGSSSSGAAIANNPCGDAFFLEVETISPGAGGAWIGRIQRLTEYRGRYIYIRRLSTNGSGAWVQTNWYRYAGTEIT